MKPSHRRIPNRERPDGFGSGAPYIHYGPIARTVEDVALLLDVMAGPHPGDPHALPEDGTEYRSAIHQNIEGRSIAYSADLGIFPLSEDVRSVVDEAVTAFEEADATVVETDSEIPYTHRDLCRVWIEMHEYILAKTNEAFIGSVRSLYHCGFGVSDRCTPIHRLFDTPPLLTDPIKRTDGIDLFGDHRGKLTPAVAEQMERGLNADSMSLVIALAGAFQ